MGAIGEVSVFRPCMVVEAEPVGLRPRPLYGDPYADAGELIKRLVEHGGRLSPFFAATVHERRHFHDLFLSNSAVFDLLNAASIVGNGVQLSIVASRNGGHDATPLLAKDRVSGEWVPNPEKSWSEADRREIGRILKAANQLGRGFHPSLEWIAFSSEFYPFVELGLLRPDGSGDSELLSDEFIYRWRGFLKVAERTGGFERSFAVHNIIALFNLSGRIELDAAVLSTMTAGELHSLMKTELLLSYRELNRWLREQVSAFSELYQPFWEERPVSDGWSLIELLRFVVDYRDAFAARVEDEPEIVTDIERWHRWMANEAVKVPIYVKFARPLELETEITENYMVSKWLSHPFNTQFFIYMDGFGRSYEPFGIRAWDFHIQWSYFVYHLVFVGLKSPELWRSSLWAFAEK